MEEFPSFFFQLQTTIFYDSILEPKFEWIINGNCGSGGYGLFPLWHHSFILPKNTSDRIDCQHVGWYVTCWHRLCCKAASSSASFRPEDGMMLSKMILLISWQSMVARIALIHFMSNIVCRERRNLSTRMVRSSTCFIGHKQMRHMLGMRNPPISSWSLRRM